MVQIAGLPHTQLTNLNLTNQLRIRGVLVSPSGIVETDVNYQVVLGDKFINCLGSITITLINIANAVDEITITSTNGTVTLAADATIQTPSTFTTGTGGTVYPARGQWHQKN